MLAAYLLEKGDNLCRVQLFPLPGTSFLPLPGQSVKAAAASAALGDGSGQRLCVPVLCVSRMSAGQLFSQGPR